MSARWSAALLAIVLVGCAHQAPSRLGAAGAAAAAAVAPEHPVAELSATGLDDGDEEPFDEEPPAPAVSDPLGPWNRAMFHFNDRLYFWVIKPIARGYRAVVPRLARTGVENFFHNLRAPLRFVSDVIRLKPRDAGIELGRFMINSSWGVLGFGDFFADDPEAKTPDTDLGLALATHGVPGGPYVVWPFFGPSTLRDSVALVGDWALEPVTYIKPLGASLAVRSYDYVNATSFRIGDYEAFKEAAIDPYLAVRDAYLQNRAQRARE